MKLDGWLFALQIVNFLVLVWLLQHFLYRPARRALDRRKEAWAREQQSLAERQARLGALEAESKAQREGVLAERKSLLAQTQVEVQAERHRLLEEVRSDAERIRAQSRAAVEREWVQAGDRLMQRAGDLAVELARKLARETAGVDVQQALFERALAALPESMLALAETKEIEIVSAESLSSDQVARLKAQLSGLGYHGAACFRVDPMLLAGLQIRVSDAILHFDWEDALTRARDALRIESGTSRRA